MSNASKGDASTLPPIPWIWFLLLGGICTVLGFIGVVDLGFAYALTEYSVLFFGILMTFAGVSHIVGGLFVRPWSGALVQILCGLMYLLAGVVAFTEPLLAAAITTLLLSIALIVSGVLRILLAFQHRRVLTWLGLALGGIVTILVGVYIFRRWPWDSLWVIGLFLAIDLLLQGMSWLALGINLRAVDRALRAGLPMEFRTAGDAAAGR